MSQYPSLQDYLLLKYSGRKKTIAFSCVATGDPTVPFYPVLTQMALVTVGEPLVTALHSSGPFYPELTQMALVTLSQKQNQTKTKSSHDPGK